MMAIMNDNEAKTFKFSFKKPGKHLFWAWIAYQSVKGILTTSLIWIPLVYSLVHH